MKELEDEEEVDEVRALRTVMVELEDEEGVDEVGSFEDSDSGIYCGGSRLGGNGGHDHIPLLAGR
ncbi:hypothetical protein CVT26_002245 [Gymnopilus dilepis]|uniref:Uncharacterized protein n=1 Tax=Gymnopilus dilepis TaxID=231916 RepID=A0A409YN55_9AGAR|nr:hypothetical protein CVT26_002245 [Gymnopilus dilepis]